MRPIESLVKHLDNNEFNLAKSYLSNDVVYRFRGQTICGADRVIKCYEDSYESVKDQLDEIILESDIVDLGSNSYRTNYTDILFKNGEKHIHRCYQELLLDNDKVVEIRHFDIQGEVETLNLFFNKHKIVRKKT